MFEKKVAIFKKKDKATWEQIRASLREAGIRCSATHYTPHRSFACGCGGKLDPRDFGSNGKVDRDLYAIYVKESEKERAEQLLTEQGIVLVIDEDAATDIAHVKNREAMEAAAPSPDQ